MPSFLRLNTVLGNVENQAAFLDSTFFPKLQSTLQNLTYRLSQPLTLKVNPHQAALCFFSHLQDNVYFYYYY